MLRVDMDDCIERSRFDRAQDLLAALRPSDARWGPDPTKWIFRGHGDSSWRLLPLVNRRKELRRFLGDIGELDGDDRYCVPKNKHALQLLRTFANALDSAGRDIPGGAKVMTLLN